MPPTTGTALFASGNGSNVQRIAEYFASSDILSIKAIYCNKPDAYVLQRARNLDIPSVVFSREQFYNSGSILSDLKSREVEWIILAGFLWLIPAALIEAYPSRIINIHPALLPKYGGKGMYGGKVHESVIAAKEKESGITIHYVNEEYDAGQVIFQAKCKISADDTPDTLAARIHELEYEHYPRVIGEVIRKHSMNFNKETSK